jgi:hypothetical protein
MAYWVSMERLKSHRSVTDATLIAAEELAREA